MKTEDQSRKILIFIISLILLLSHGGQALSEATEDDGNLVNNPSQWPSLPPCPDGLAPPCAPAPFFRSEPGSTSKSVPLPKVKMGRGDYKGWIMAPAGSFMMGSREDKGRPDERPRREVFIKRFYAAPTEVTAIQYCRFLNEMGNEDAQGFDRVKTHNEFCPVENHNGRFRPKEGMEGRPIVCVSWRGAMDYAQWSGGRLPTAAEWEKLALLTIKDLPGDYLTILSRDDSVDVRLALPGKLGIRGMVGNVWEWCLDWYEADYYHNGEKNNPQGPKLGTMKEIRGGSWASAEASKRIRNRHCAGPTGYYRTVGFRVVRD